jgi:hypothetical protein
MSNPIVKIKDKQLAKTVGVFALPAIVFFRYVPNNIILLHEQSHCQVGGQAGGQDRWGLRPPAIVNFRYVIT